MQQKIETHPANDFLSLEFFLVTIVKIQLFPCIIQVAVENAVMKTNYNIYFQRLFKHCRYIIFLFFKTNNKFGFFFTAVLISFNFC